MKRKFAEKEWKAGKGNFHYFYRKAYFDSLFSSFFFWLIEKKRRRKKPKMNGNYMSTKQKKFNINFIPRQNN